MGVRAMCTRLTGRHAGECFICAEPKVSYDADNGACGLRIKKTCKSARARFQI